MTKHETHETVDNNKVIRDELIKVINRSSETLHETIRQETEALIEEVRRLLPESSVTVPIPRQQRTKTEQVSNLLNRRPRSGKSYKNIYPPLAISADAFEIVAEIKNASDIESRVDSKSNHERQLALIAILAQAMLSGDKPVFEEKLAAATGYSVKGIPDGMRYVPCILETSDFELVGNRRMGWRLVKKG